MIGRNDSSVREWRAALSAAPLPLIFAAIVIVSFTGFSERLRANEKALCASVAFHASEEISASMARLIDSGEGLSSELGSDPEPGKGYIQTLSEAILRASPSVTGVSVAPSAIVKYHFPENGNESLIGHDLLSNPERRDSLTRAAELKTALVSGPFESVDGGSFLFVRYPVFSRDKLWGFVSLTIDSAKLFESFNLESHYPGIRFAISGTSGKAATGESEQAPVDRFLGGTAAVWSRGGVSQRISLPGAEWRIHVMPFGGWTLVDPYLYILFGAGLTASLILFFVFYSRARLRKAKAGNKESWLETSVKAAGRDDLARGDKEANREKPAREDEKANGEEQPSGDEAVKAVQIPEKVVIASRNADSGSEEARIPATVLPTAASVEESPGRFDQEPAMGSLFPGLADIAKHGGRQLRFRGPAVKGELYMPEASALASAGVLPLLKDAAPEERPRPAPPEQDAEREPKPGPEPKTPPKPAATPGPAAPSGPVAAVPAPKQEFLFSLEEEPSREDCAILVVDDSDANRDIMGRMLSLRGYHADFAGSGEEAISLCAGRQYDIIFMDCFMPDMDGYRTCAAIREKAPDSGAKIIGMSARIGEQELRRCRDAGMDELLAKPFTMKQMLAHLDKGT